MKPALRRLPGDAWPLAGCLRGNAFGGLHMFVDKLQSVEGQLGRLSGTGPSVTAWTSTTSTGRSISTRHPGRGHWSRRRDRSAARRWQSRLQYSVVAADLISIIVASALARAMVASATALLAGVLVGGSWLVVAVLRASYGRTALAAPTIARGVGQTLMATIAILAAINWTFAPALSRRYVLLALGLIFLLDWATRLSVVRLMRRQRTRVGANTRAVLVGSDSAIAALSDSLAATDGLQVVAVCLPSDIDEVAATAHVTGADLVVVAAGDEMSAQVTRQLCWRLEGRGLDLVISTNFTEVEGDRLRVRDVAGRPMISVDLPCYYGVTRTIKNAVERIAAVLMLAVLAPVFLLIAVVIRLTSAGPAFFTQTRVGRNGRHFTLYKFRSMTVDAEDRQADLALANEASDGLLFKIRQDPRVTRVGSKLRKYSLDELPQLINVARGSMSLVGPRPPLPVEVANYSPDVHRRLLVKPGLTGLWQVSGRSDLSWEESVRLDLHYVENWSLARDLRILGQTVGAVASASGSY
jgi:exopolysaccharide biosynthesis polyprenyl glycosylphosphotransferase